MAALATLASSGIDAVRVEPLARQLGVSKGSFYWHFKDRPALLDALLELWDTELTRGLIEKAASLPTPAKRLRSLALDALEITFHGVDAARAESAMQAWAAVDERAAQRLCAVDAARTDYLTVELQAAGLQPTAARRMANALYLALLGLYAARAYNADLADDQAYLDLVDLVLGNGD